MVLGGKRALLPFRGLGGDEGEREHLGGKTKTKILDVIETPLLLIGTVACTDL